MVVRTIISVTLYGSQFDDGLRSSKYPFLSSATWRGIRILAPLYKKTKWGVNWSGKFLQKFINDIVSDVYKAIKLYSIKCLYERIRWYSIKCSQEEVRWYSFRCLEELVIHFQNLQKGDKSYRFVWLDFKKYNLKCLQGNKMVYIQMFIRGYSKVSNVYNRRQCVSL